METVKPRGRQASDAARKLEDFAIYDTVIARGGVLKLF